MPSELDLMAKGVIDTPRHARPIVRQAARDMATTEIVQHHNEQERLRVANRVGNVIGLGEEILAELMPFVDRVRQRVGGGSASLVLAGGNNPGGDELKAMIALGTIQRVSTACDRMLDQYARNA